MASFGGSDSVESDQRHSLARPVNTSLFVRNVADRTTTDDLRALFRPYGRLFDVYIPKDYYSKRPRGFAYVQFEETDDAKEAQENLNFRSLHGRHLEVDFAKGDRKTPHEMRDQEIEDPTAAFRSVHHRHEGSHHRHHRSRSGDRRHRHHHHRHHSHGGRHRHGHGSSSSRRHRRHSRHAHDDDESRRHRRHRRRRSVSEDDDDEGEEEYEATTSKRRGRRRRHKRRESSSSGDEEDSSKSSNSRCSHGDDSAESNPHAGGVGKDTVHHERAAPRDDGRRRRRRRRATPSESSTSSDEDDRNNGHVETAAHGQAKSPDSSKRSPGRHGIKAERFISSRPFPDEPTPPGESPFRDD